MHESFDNFIKYMSYENISINNNIVFLETFIIELFNPWFKISFSYNIMLLISYKKYYLLQDLNILIDLNYFISDSVWL